jgi:hypothetical protein
MVNVCFEMQGKTTYLVLEEVSMYFAQFNITMLCFCYHNCELLHDLERQLHENKLQVLLHSN